MFDYNTGPVARHLNIRFAALLLLTSWRNHAIPERATWHGFLSLQRRVLLTLELDLPVQSLRDASLWERRFRFQDLS
jgi:hypothetical protein